MPNNFEEEFAKSFIESCKKDGISIDYTEFKDCEYKKHYNYLVDEILKSHPIEDNKNYKPLDYNEIIYRAVIIVKYMLRDAVSDQELLDASKLIVTTNSECVLDGYYLGITDTRANKTHEAILVPGMNKTSSVICLVKLLIHYFEKTLKVKTFDNYRYNFTMGFLSEAISCDLLEKEGIEPNLLYKIQGIRLDTIKFQQEALIELDRIIKQIPMIKLEHDFSSINAYERGRNHAFMVGFINQVCLLNRYLDDNKAFLSKVNEIFKGDIMVSDMLDYYGIDIKKNKIVDEVVQVVKKYK